MKTKRKLSFSALFSGVLLAIGVVYLQSCISIPEQVEVLHRVGTEAQLISVDSCETVLEKSVQRDSSAKLDPNGFTVVSWNTHKGSEEGFENDFKSQARQADILLYQEVALDEDFLQSITESDHNWLFAVAFKHNDIDTGILTASREHLTLEGAFREPEPLLVIPKMILMSSHPIAGFAEHLLVVNLHMVNFTLSSDVVRRQMKAVENLVAEHNGPVIIAGDFNTWSDEREAVVRGSIERLGLASVQFSPDNRSMFMNHTVDRIFYRGLKVLNALSTPVESSDHNPLLVRFELEGAGRAYAQVISGLPID